MGGPLFLCAELIKRYYSMDGNVCQWRFRVVARGRMPFELTNRGREVGICYSKRVWVDRWRGGRKARGLGSDRGYRVAAGRLAVIGKSSGT